MNTKDIRLKLLGMANPEGVEKCKVEAKFLVAYMFEERHLDLAEIAIILKMLNQTVEELLKEKGRDESKLL